jgi:glycosyltransferase involved in cell wall biosynthesis
MTRVVHVATRFLASGTERTIADIVAGYAGPGVEHVLVVGREHDPASIRGLVGDIQVVIVPDLVRRPDPVRDLRAARALGRAIRRFQPDVVHTVQSKSGILGRFAARRAGVQRLVHTVNMANFGQGFNPVLGLVYREAERRCAKWTDQFTVNGRDVRDRFVRAGVADEDRFELIRSSVDVAPFRETATRGRLAAREGLGLQSDGPIVLVAGSLDARKGAHELPGFLEALRRELPAARLLIAGDGPLRSKIEADLATRGLYDAVTFLGFTSRLPEAMAASDCLVMLSRAEGLATVLVHAAAAGLPFVSNDVDGPAEMISRGAAGALSRIGDVEAAATLAGQAIASGRGDPVDLGEWDPAHVRERYRTVFASVVERGPQH